MKTSQRHAKNIKIEFIQSANCTEIRAPWKKMIANASNNTDTIRNFIKRRSFMERKYIIRTNKRAKKLMDTPNNLPIATDSSDAFPVRIFKIRTGKRLYPRLAAIHKIAAYKSDLFKVWVVSNFLAFNPAALGNITRLIAKGKNRNIFPTICAKE